MSWSDDFWSGTYQTKGSNVGAGVNTYYSKNFLDFVVNNLNLIQLGQVRPLPMGEGDTVKYFRWLQLAAQSAAAVTAATLSDGLLPNAMTLKGQAISVPIAEYGAFAQITSLLSKTHIDKRVSSAVELLAEHAATIMDTLCHQVVCSHMRPLVVDFNTVANLAEFSFTGTLTSDSAATTAICSALTNNVNFGNADDDLNQAILVITSGTGYGQSQPVSDYTASSGTMTLPANWGTNPKSGDSFVVVSPHGLTDMTKKVTRATLLRAFRLLKQAKAPKFEKGAYALLVDPSVIEQMLNDEKFFQTALYKDQLNEGLFANEIGMYAGFRIIEETNAFIFPIAAHGTAGTSYGPGSQGANLTNAFTVGNNYVQSSLALGKNAFGVTGFQDSKGNIRKPPVVIKRPGSNDTSQPLDRFSTAGWQVEAAYKELNPNFGVQIWTPADVFI